MSLAGKLEAHPLAELLQILASSGETGKLRLTRHDREGVIVFRNGKIVYTASSSARQTLGNLLLLEQLVSEQDLNKALELQHQERHEKRLGAILLEIGAIDAESLSRVVHNQTERVISEFIGWKDGYFKFDRIELSDLGEVEVDAQEFLMREGLSTDLMLSELGSKLEALQSSELPDDTVGRASRGRDLTSLKSIMGEIRSPQFTGEITQKILSFAQELFARGVLFVTRQDGFGVMGQFGVGPAEGVDPSTLRRLEIPLDAPSILVDAAERQQAVHGRLADTEWNRRLIEALGGGSLGAAVAAPMTVNGRVLLVLYCDRLLDQPRPGWLEELELLMLQAGLAMEKDLLAKRIEHYDGLRRLS